MPVLDFDKRFPREIYPSLIEFAQHVLRLQQERGSNHGLRLGDPEAPTGPAVKGYVDAGDVPGYGKEGRWSAKCDGTLPSGQPCTGAEYVSFRHPVFMCCSCWNHANGHEWRPVTLPDPVKRAGIEDALHARPGDKRTWYPHEAVADLEAENVEHGHPRSVKIRG